MKHTSHLGHFIMCLLTGFIWVPIWIWCAASNAKYNRDIEFQQRQRQIAVLERLEKRQQLTN